MSRRSPRPRRARSRCRGEVDRPSRIGRPGEHLGVLVSGIVHDGMSDPAGRRRVLDLVEQGGELLVAMTRRTAPECGARHVFSAGSRVVVVRALPLRTPAIVRPPPDASTSMMHHHAPGPHT